MVKAVVFDKLMQSITWVAQRSCHKQNFPATFCSTLTSQSLCSCFFCSEPALPQGSGMSVPVKLTDDDSPSGSELSAPAAKKAKLGLQS